MMAVERLLDQLFDAETLARQFKRLLLEAASVFASAPDLRAQLAAAWTDRLLADEAVFQEMILLYEECLGPLAEQSLLAVLVSAEAEEKRARSAAHLGYLGSEDCVESLMDCLYDESSVLRHDAIEALGRRGDPKALETLKARLSDTDSDVRQVTVTVLGALCGADVSPPPTSFLEAIMPLTSRQEVDSEVIEEVKEWLRTALSDPDDQVRAESAIVIGCLGEAQALDTLVDLLADEGLDQYQRTRMARALSRLGSQDALDVRSCPTRRYGVPPPRKSGPF
jgi:HEAT repeat protein